MLICDECGLEADWLCSSCGGCQDCCGCEAEAGFDADEMGEDPEED